MDGIAAVVVFVVGCLLGALAVWLAMRNRKDHEAEARIASLDAQLSAKNERLDELSAQAQKSENSLRTTQELLSKTQADKASLETALQKDREASESRIKLLQETEERLKKEFENLANRIFEEKNRTFTTQNKDNIATLLNPLREQMGEFRRRIDDVYDRESKDRVSLMQEIKHLKDLNVQVSQDTVNLTNALKGESKTQGNWGELILERLLEQSGLAEGREYETQVHLKEKAGGSATRYPDVVVHLPENKDVVIDAKVSLKAYEEYCSAQTDEVREVALKAHLASVAGHMKGLSIKSYEDLAGINTPDFVLMFMPVEAAFITAIRSDPAIFQTAFDRGIILVCPSTLLMALRIIRNIWQREHQNKHAIDIAERAGALYDKFVSFVEGLQAVGRKMNDAREAYDEAFKQLSTGRGNLVKQSQDLIAMGIKAKKRLPKEILDSETSQDNTPALGE